MLTNAEWIRILSTPGAEQATALEELRQILLRAALFTFDRNASDLQRLSYDEVVRLAEDCAQEALLAILNHLDEFRGDSKFTTWAYKFAVNQALTTARRAHWRDISLETVLPDGDGYEWLDAGSGSEHDPHQQIEQSEIILVIKDIIRNGLTPRQQIVLKLMVFDEVPMDVIVERLETNRNAVYKLLHDARKKVKQQLEARGFGVEDSFSLFSDDR